MLSADQCVAQLAETSADAVIARLARLLLAKGIVRDTFEKAALLREKRSPTGLPFEPIAVALPHAEPDHVVSPAIAVATLAAPVKFRQMGSPGTTLAVRLVVMPALTQKEQAGAELARVIERLQSAELRLALAAAPTSHAIHEVLVARWSAG